MGIERPDWTPTVDPGAGDESTEGLGQVTHHSVPGSAASPGVTLVKDGKIVRSNWGEDASQEPIEQETDAETEKADQAAEAPAKRPDWPIEPPAETEEPAETPAEQPVEQGDPTPVQEFAQAVLDQAEHSAEVTDAFDRMPSSIQIAIADELEAEVDQSAPLILEEDLADFIGDAIGGELWEEWGNNAEYRFSVLHHRFNRLRNAIPETDRGAFDDFIDGLPPAAAKEALRRLAG